MAGDDLNQPLGLDAPRRAAQRDVPYHIIAFSGIALLAVSLVGFFLVTADPQGGEPYAVASIAPAVAPRQPAVEKLDADTTATVVAPKRLTTAEQAEQESGVSVVRPGGGLPPNSLIIDVPQTIGVHLAPAPDRRLVEKSRYGLLPRVGPDGARPRDIYARPVMTATSLPANAPRIALIIGGVGLSESATEDAIANLPGAVTLGFAPYGADLERTVARARGQGHEVILQVPMEPFDQAAPGPHMLLAEGSDTETADNLHWFMSRFSGYVGIGNFLGARFTANQTALTPVLREIADRGLFYADDGSSMRSLAASMAPNLALPFARVDIILDATNRDTIDSALVKLEAMARTKGIAIGMASDLPPSIERIGRFARSLEARGIALVPLSAVVNKTPSDSTVIREP